MSAGWSRSSQSENWYDIAQICTNGHIISWRTVSSPVHKRNFCNECGAATITKCPNCDADIRGYYHVAGVISLYPDDTIPPMFCDNCGKEYPWTEARLAAAQELARSLESLTEEEKEALAQSVEDLVRNTPKSTVAANKFKSIIAKTSVGVAESFKSILTDILSEAIKKSLWP